MDALIDEAKSYFEEGKNEEYISTLEKCLPLVTSCEEYWCLQFNMSLVTKPLKGLKICIYAYEIRALGKWDTSGIKNGITGSEEAIICVGNTLSKMGHTVHVYADPQLYSADKLEYSNPRFFNHRLFPKSSFGYDICLCWRRTQFDICKEKAKYVIYWPHDFSRFVFPTNNMDLASYLSKSHKEALIASNPALKDKEFVIAGNGVDFSYWDNLKIDKIRKMKIPFKCIYASNYVRGLENLLDIWPDILKAFPNATLDVYYGRETWNCWNQEKVNQVVDKMNRLPGVTEKGKVGHQELAEAFCRSTFWLYPYVGGSETFCITAIKAQRSGCIPVVVKKDALLETVHSSAFSISNYDRKLYLEKVIEAFSNVEKININMFIEFARTYSWERVVNFWIKKFENNSALKN